MKQLNKPEFEKIVRESKCPYCDRELSEIDCKMENGGKFIVNKYCLNCDLIFKRVSRGGATTTYRLDKEKIDQFKKQYPQRFHFIENYEDKEKFVKQELKRRINKLEEEENKGD